MLFGGEVAVLVILEAVIRLLPGVLGNADSLVEESHADGLLEAPVYTKPALWRGLEVPEVLRSGDHARIARWRRDRRCCVPPSAGPICSPPRPRHAGGMVLPGAIPVPGADMAK